MIELEKFFARLRSGVGGACNGRFQRSDGRRLMMTLTDELFLPTRIVYRVKDREGLISRFHNLRCTMFDLFRTRWVWQYEYFSLVRRRKLVAMIRVLVAAARNFKKCYGA